MRFVQSAQASAMFKPVDGMHVNGVAEINDSCDGIARVETATIADEGAVLFVNWTE